MAEFESQVVSDANGSTLLSPLESGGVVREAVGRMTVPSGSSSGDVFRLARIPARARAVQVLFASGGGGTTGAGNLGVYEANGGPVVDADLVATGVSTTTAADLADVSGLSPAQLEQSLADNLSLNSEDNDLLDLSLTLTTGADADQDVIAIVRYVVTE
jgi:hypothetical protein